MFRAHKSPYGPIWARPGPLKSGKSYKKTHLFFYIPYFSEKKNTFFQVTYLSQKFIVFNLQTTFFDGKMCFFSLSTQNNAESFRNFIKNSVLDPKRTKLVQKSYGKFTESLRNLPRPVQEDP